VRVTGPAALTRLGLVSGLVAFGGGFAVVAKVRQLVVERRAWMSDAEFVECVAVASALPGTTSSNLFTLIGYRLHGFVGALAATIAFLAPSAFLMVALAASYGALRSVVAIEAVLDAMGAAVVGVVVAVANELRGPALRGPLDAVVAIGAAVALATGRLSLLEVVLIAGFVGALAREGAAPAPDRTDRDETVAWLPMLFVFARIGAATFGGGFAMVAPMTHEAVSRGWLDPHTIADAVAVGQLTPGPVAICATFIGYRAAGVGGAIAATAGVFGPPLVFSVLAARSLAAFRANRRLQGALRGVSAAVVGIIVAAAIALARVSIHGGWGVVIAAATIGVRLAAPRSSPVWPLVGAAAVALARTAVGR
jgi:chromate transporter